jgi:sugar lactone lactonase YvrE
VETHGAHFVEVADPSIRHRPDAAKGFMNAAVDLTPHRANGLAIDPKGRLVACEHGDRRVSVLTEGGGKLTLVDRYEGKRLNSPNDLVYRSDGTLYFTDPPFGLPGMFDDPKKEIPFSGVYRVRDGQIHDLWHIAWIPADAPTGPDPVEAIRTGDWVIVDADSGTITVTRRSTT